MKRYISPSIYIRVMKQPLLQVGSLEVTDENPVTPEDAESKQSLILNFWGEEFNAGDDFLSSF